jgi:hypothetical protein
VYGRFAEIAAILQRKYGARIRDLVPSGTSEFALYGDSSRGPMTVEAVRAQLASGAPKKYTYFELDDAIAKGLWDTLNLYLVAGGDPSAPTRTMARPCCTWQPAVTFQTMVRLLVAAGANVNALDRTGTTPLRAVLTTRPDRAEGCAGRGRRGTQDAEAGDRQDARGSGRGIGAGESSACGEAPAPRLA